MSQRDAFRPDPRLFPFDSHFLPSSVGPVHYVDEGEGPPLLLLHGNPTWSFLYRGIIIRLRKHFRCIAVDYPGFGLSVHPPDYGYTPAEHAGIVGELMRELDLRELTIMGQDWGGPIGMRSALDAPERVSGLVMGNTWYWPVEALHMRAFAMLMSSAFMQGLILRKNLFVERVMPIAVKHPLPVEVMNHYRWPFPDANSRVGVAEFPKQILGSELWLGDIADRVPDVLGHLPLLMVWGTGDMAFTLSTMTRFKADFRRVRTVHLDAKHYIQEDAPAEISEAIQKFMESPPA